MRPQGESFYLRRCVSVEVTVPEVTADPSRGIRLEDAEGDLDGSTAAESSMISTPSTYVWSTNESSS